MRRTGFIVFAAVSAIILTSVPAAAKQSAAEKEAAELQARREKEAAVALNGTTWTIDMTRLGQKGDKPVSDTLKFDQGKVTSIQFGKNGFLPSNITVTVGEGDLVIWETMQSKEGAGVVFWRGERQGDIMRGILSKQPADGKNEDFSFAGKIAGVPPPPAPAVPGAAPPERQPATPAAPPPAMTPAPAQETAPAAQPKPTPKKKKGWWW